MVFAAIMESNKNDFLERPMNISGDKCYANVNLHSPGFLRMDGGIISILDYSLPILLAQLTLIFFVTQALHFILRRLFLPRLVSEILAGILLGQSFLGQIPFVGDILSHKQGQIFIELLSKFGYVFFIFLSGVKMDPKILLIAGSKPWCIGFLSVIIPSAGIIIFNSTLLNKTNAYRAPALRSILLTQNLYSFPVISHMLFELKITNSALGRLALSSALISDFSSNMILTGISNGRMSKFSFFLSKSTQSLYSITLLLATIVFVGSPLCRWIVKSTPNGQPVCRGHLAIIIALLLLVFIATDNVGLHYMYGPFILGLVVPDGPPLGATLVDKFEAMVSGLYAPLLVTFCGMQVNLSMTLDVNFIVSICKALFVCLGMKVGGTMLVSLACGIPPNFAAALALIMSTQGVVQLSFYHNNVVNQTYDWRTFSLFIIFILLQALIFHPLARFLYNYSRVYSGDIKRDVGHVPLNSGIRILTCAHRLEEVFGIRKVLEACFPTIDIPVSVYALHLLELVGRAHPQLINHQVGDNLSSTDNKTQQMINAMSEFEKDYKGRVMVQQFTAMSLGKFMHHDICSIAFSKLVSLAILPFHRKWNHQGQLVDDNNHIRAMNNEVLANAVCSVAILIDRSKMNGVPSSKYVVGVPFFGGEDDCEALAFAIRMVRSPNNRLIIIRFLPWEMDTKDADVIMDYEVLKLARAMSQENENVAYKEDRVRDGADSALIIHEMEDVCDLMVVGRRQNDEMPQLAGLSEWNDLPELGPIGDMLAAPDLTNPISVLVVQHQCRTKPPSN